MPVRGIKRSLRHRPLIFYWRLTNSQLQYHVQRAMVETCTGLADAEGGRGVDCDLGKKGEIYLKMYLGGLQ